MKWGELRAKEKWKNKQLRFSRKLRNKNWLHPFLVNLKVGTTYCPKVYVYISTIQTDIYETKGVSFSRRDYIRVTTCTSRKKNDSLCSSSPDDKSPRLDPKTPTTCQAVRAEYQLSYSLSFPRSISYVESTELMLCWSFHVQILSNASQQQFL